MTIQKVYEVGGTQMEKLENLLVFFSYVSNSIRKCPESVPIASIAHLPTPDVPYGRPTPSGSGDTTLFS